LISFSRLDDRPVVKDEAAEIVAAERAALFRFVRVRIETKVSNVAGTNAALKTNKTFLPISPSFLDYACLLVAYYVI